MKRVKKYFSVKSFWILSVDSFWILTVESCFKGLKRLVMFANHFLVVSCSGYCKNYNCLIHNCRKLEYISIRNIENLSKNFVFTPTCPCFFLVFKRPWADCLRIFHSYLKNNIYSPWHLPTSMEILFLTMTKKALANYTLIDQFSKFCSARSQLTYKKT